MIFYLPKLSSLNDKLLIKNEIIKAYRFLIPLLLFITFIVYFNRGLIVRILFSPSFTKMESLFSYQLIGDFFKISSWILSINLLAEAKSKILILTEIIFSFSYVGFTYVLINKFGLRGAPFAYMLNYIFYFAILILIYRELLFIKVEK
jgi:PST family polysaccharide transporter